MSLGSFVSMYHESPSTATLLLTCKISGSLTKKRNKYFLNLIFAVLKHLNVSAVLPGYHGTELVHRIFSIKRKDRNFSAHRVRNLKADTQTRLSDFSND